MVQTSPVRVPLPDVLIHNQVAVQQTAHQLSTASVPVYTGIILTVDSDNTGTVYVGSEDITVNNGYPLESIFLEIQDLNRVWLISDGAGNMVSYIGS